MRRSSEDARRSMAAGHSSSPGLSSTGSRRPATVDASRPVGGRDPAPRMAQTQHYSQYTDVSAKYGGGSPTRNSDSLLGAPMKFPQGSSSHQPAPRGYPAAHGETYNRLQQAASTYSGPSHAPDSNYHRRQPQAISVPNPQLRSTGPDMYSGGHRSHTRGHSGYIQERTTKPEPDALYQSRAHSMPTDSPQVSPGGRESPSRAPTSPSGRVKKMSEIPKSLSLAAPGLAAMIRDQVMDGVKEAEKAAYMDPKLTSANNTLVLPPFSDMSPAVRSYLYWRLLDVERLKKLQACKAINCHSRSAHAHVNDQDDFIAVTNPAKCTLSALLPLTSMGDGNCCLHAASLALWGIQDRVGTLRNAILEMTKRQEDLFKKCWKTPIERSKEEWEKEWRDLVQRAGTDYAYLAQVHLFILAHVIRRPIIVYAPTEQQPEACEKAPILLAYESSHFVPLTYHLSSWPPTRREEWPLIPLEVEGTLLPAPFSRLMAPKGWSDRRLYEEYLNAEPEETDGTLAVRVDLRKLCADASQRLGRSIKETNSHVGQLIQAFLEEGRAEACEGAVKRTPVLTRQDSALARSLQQEEFDRQVSRPFSNLSFH